MRLSQKNREQLELVALGLQDLVGSVTFVGGAVLGVYLTELGAPAGRPTEDVDVVTSGMSFYSELEVDQRLRELDFRHDTSEGAPTCRWIYKGAKVDVMSPKALKTGFTNTWYEHCPENRFAVPLGHVQIFVPEAPLYAAMKVEAYKNRGANDPLTSKDLEDLMALLNGRPELCDELANSDVPEIQEFVRDGLAQAATGAALYLEGIVPEPERLALVEERLWAIVNGFNF